MGIDKNSSFNLHHKWNKGKRNLITDVPGVKVGHVTVHSSMPQCNDINTGVTAILPHEGNLFQEKVMAGVSILNGFGKTTGLVQIEELGTIETPIVLTNTLSVGTALTAMTKYMLEKNSDIGVTTGTVNCIVAECNDGPLSDIRGMHVKENHIMQALRNAKEDFEEGAVGAGAGMTCLGFKGGIGSASRTLTIDEDEYTIGALVMSNFGKKGNLVIGDRHVGEETLDWVNERTESEKNKEELSKDRGSIIIIIATDIPLNERQLKRVAKRSSIALGRTGSFIGNGSGDIAIAFSTANKIPHYSEKNILESKLFYDENIDVVFEAAVEAVEESIVSSLYHAKTTKGIRNKISIGLNDALRSCNRKSIFIEKQE